MLSMSSKTILFWSTPLNIILRTLSVVTFVLLGLGGQVANAQSGADLSLTKRFDRHFVRVGQNVTYVITLKNLGPGLATDVQFGDSLPDQLNLVAFRCNRGVPAGGSY